MRSESAASELLTQALAPIGLDLSRPAGGGNGFELRSEGRLAGYALPLARTVYVILFESARIHLAKPIAREYPMRSAADLYERLSKRLIDALRPATVPGRRVPVGVEHRTLLCLGTSEGHIPMPTTHGLASRTEDRETWRCSECGHDTSIPREKRRSHRVDSPVR